MGEKGEKSSLLIEERWRRVKEHLKFTDKELELFKSHPAHVKAMEMAPLFSTHKIVIEVIEAHNCAAGYKAGDKFTLDSEGCLIIDECPARICAGAVYSFKPLIDRIWQAFFDNKTEILHDTVHCPDVGVYKGGAGTVLMKAKAIHKEQKKEE